MIVRDERESDRDAVQNLIHSAFRDMPYSSGSEHFIMDALRSSGGATLSLVADENKEIIGQLVFSPVTIEGAASNWHVLGPVAVRPDRQRQGVGKALIEFGLERLRAAGSAGCVLLGDPDYYRRFGFRSDPALYVSDVPAGFFMALPFGATIPAGRVQFHPAFSVTTSSR